MEDTPWCSIWWDMLLFQGGAEVIIWLWQLCRAIHGSAPLGNSCQREEVFSVQFTDCSVEYVQSSKNLVWGEGKSKVDCVYDIEHSSGYCPHWVMPSGQCLPSKGGNLEVFRHCLPGVTNSTTAQLLSHVGARTLPRTRTAHYHTHTNAHYHITTT